MWCSRDSSLSALMMVIRLDAVVLGQLSLGGKVAPRSKLAPLDALEQRCVDLVVKRQGLLGSTVQTLGSVMASAGRWTC